VEMIHDKMCYIPLPEMIKPEPAPDRGWANYFSFGYPTMAYRHINSYVSLRLTLHLKRRSQRPYRPPHGKSMYQHLNEMGLIYL
jgi:RNA-directed DNA polymerase